MAADDIASRQQPNPKRAKVGHEGSTESRALRVQVLFFRLMMLTEGLSVLFYPVKIVQVLCARVCSAHNDNMDGEGVDSASQCL